MRHTKLGFTLVELLTVISIVSLVLGLLIPAVQMARESARRFQCQNNLKQLGLALHNYESAHRRIPPAMIWHGRGEPLGNGIFPVGTIDRVALGITADSDRLHSNWVIAILPFLEQTSLHLSLSSGSSINEQIKRPFRTTLLSVMNCPSDGFNAVPYERGLLSGIQGDMYSRGNYAINMGPNRPCFSFSAQCREGFNSDTNDLQRTASRVWGAGISGFNTSFRLADFPEGLSNLVALDEIRSGISPIDPRGTWALGMVGASITAGFTGGPNNAVIGDGINSCGILKLTLGDRALNQMRMPCQTAAMQANFSAGARSLHVGIVNVLKLDGSVEAVSDQIDLQTWVGIHSKDSNLVERLFAL